MLVALDQVAKNRTSLVIAHRRRTAELADRVVRLVDGRVVAEGDARLVDEVLR